VRRWTSGIPILMYHSISASLASSQHPYFGTITTPEALDKQIRFLRENGYLGISLEQAVSDVQSGRQNSDKRVVITFDDGFEDFYTEAFPILSRYGYGATVFLPTKYIGDSGQRFNGVTCLNWSQVRELKRAGIQFGSHTVTHPQLRTLTMPEVGYELQSSRWTIEDKLGSKVESFSYPYAFPEAEVNFTRKLRESLLESGYTNGVSTMVGTVGPSSDALFLERIPVNTFDDEALFRAKLEGGYDWLHSLQYTSKVVSRYLKNAKADAVRH
jgi:peptidoglycan/xylan/chitin deacetylase (PgdA/CDA1 family)